MKGHLSFLFICQATNSEKTNLFMIIKSNILPYFFKIFIFVRICIFTAFCFSMSNSCSDITVAITIDRSILLIFKPLFSVTYHNI